MSNLKIFENPEFGAIRVIEKKGEPWFVAKDISDILGFRDANGMTRMLDADEKGTQKVSTPGGPQHMLVVNESGLYSCILRSNKPTAKKFRKWVTSEVLPSIRKSGGYFIDQEKMTPEEIVANALIVAHRIIDNKNKQIEAMKPKVEFYDTVTQSDDVVDIKQAAKILNLGYGRNTLFKKLRELKILDQYNLPYQKYIDRGYFRVVQVAKEVKGKVRIYPKTVVYQKGLDFIRKVVGNYDRNLPQKRMA